MRKLLAGAALALVVAVAGAGAGTPVAVAGPPPGAEACPMFPADSFWHADVRSLPVHERSAAWLAAMGGPTRHLHPDFGDSGTAMPYGIPYAVVDSSHPRVSVDFDYADESDPGPYPYGPDIPVEGGSDRHALMLDRDRCELSELFAVDWNGGAPTAGSGASWDLRSNALRPSGWTSADAAGLAILPGLLRRDEVLAGRIDHPIRMTASQTDRSFLWPARHQAGSARDPNRPPMGAWFRMKADVPTDGLHPHTKVIVEAFKTHGLLLADNGSIWYFTGAADAGWESRVLSELKALTAGQFEAVDASSLMVHADSGQVRGAPAPAPPPAPGTTTTTAPPTASGAPTTTSGRAQPAMSSSARPVAATTTSTAVPADPVPMLPRTEPPATTTTSTSTTATTESEPERDDGEVSAAAARTGDDGGSSRPWLWLLPLVPLVALAAVGRRYLRTRSSPATSTVTVDPSS